MPARKSKLKIRVVRGRRSRRAEELFDPGINLIAVYLGVIQAPGLECNAQDGLGLSWKSKGLSQPPSADEKQPTDLPVENG